MSTCSEIDAVLKLICADISPGEKAGNIIEYLVVIKKHHYVFFDEMVTAPAHGLEFVLIHTWERSPTEFFNCDIEELYLHHYILTEQVKPGLSHIYIGETSNRKIRIKQSLTRLKGDETTRIVLLLSHGKLAIKAYRTYIEGRLYFALRRCPGTIILNHYRMVSVSQKGLNQKFLEVAEEGIAKALEKIPALHYSPEAIETLQEQDNKPSFEMTIFHHGKLRFADASLENGRWLVKSGSYLRECLQGARDDTSKLRKSLSTGGVLRQVEIGLQRFTKDVTFSHANIAAGIVNGRMAFGPSRWVVKGLGTPLSDTDIRFLHKKGAPAKFHHPIKILDLEPFSDKNRLDLSRPQRV